MDERVDRLLDKLLRVSVSLDLTDCQRVQAIRERIAVAYVTNDGAYWQNDVWADELELLRIARRLEPQP